MRWQVKAAIQTAASLLPHRVSDAIYYRMQRLIGGLKTTEPLDRLMAGVQTWGWIVQQGADPTDKTFFEVGTGRTPMVPLAFWLMGAKGTITVDLNRYLKEEIVAENLEYIVAHQEEVKALFGEFLRQERMEDLVQFSTSSAFSLSHFFDRCCIDYVAPGDAAKTGLRGESIDFHTSYTVLEHIPPEVLVQILEEGNRIVRSGGLFVHDVDYGDHFAHSDATIPLMNFLQYSDAEWARYAGNRYMYMNRLRYDDVLALFKSAGHRILATAPSVDARSLELLISGRLRVDERFQAKPPHILATWGSWIVSEKSAGEYQTGDGSCIDEGSHDAL
jgi:SAM-dependent methyltransferase